MALRRVKFGELNIGQVTSEFTKGDCGIFAASRPPFDDRPSFGTLIGISQLRFQQFNR